MNIVPLTIILFAGLCVVFAMGMPVGFGLGSLSMILGLFTWGPQVFNVIPTTAANVMSSFVLLSIPLFLFMGQVLQRSGLGEAMFNAMHVISGRIRGGLAIGVIIVTSMMGAMVGIIGVGILTAGTIALPGMLKRGYSKHLALGCVMAGGGMGILIPPSIPMILFSSVTSTSIGKMFAGGIGPGLLMSGLFCVYIFIRCWLQPDYGPAPRKDEFVIDWNVRVTAVRDAILAFGLIFLVLGSILFGVTTPTEAAAIGAVGAVAITLIYGRWSTGVLKEASTEAMRLTSMCMWIMLGASVFSNFHMLMGAGKLLARFTFEAGLSPWWVIIMMQLSMMVLGCIIDEYIIVLICAPLYTPVAMALGFDPIWFGILMILNMEIAIQTPPYGFALFYLKGIAPPGVTMWDIYKSIGPFLAIKLIVLALCMMFPEIVLWLPNKLFPAAQ